MALGHNTSIVKDGLVFYYDMSNTQKSWIGRPSTNILTSPTNFSWILYNNTAAGANSSAANETQADGTIARVITVTGTTGSHSDIQLYSGVYSLTGGTTYTVSCMLYSNVNFNILLGAIKNSTPFTGYIPLASIPVKPGWNFVQSSGSFATSVTDARFEIMIGTAPVGAVIKVLKPQIETGLPATPFVNGTRSNTQAILDLTGNTTITANSLTYNNDGSFSYNYTSGYLTTSGLDSYNWGLNITVEAWLYHLGGTGVYRGVVTNGTVADRLGGFDLRFGREDYFGGGNNGTRLVWNITNTSGTQVSVPTYVPSNQWKCVTATYDGTTSKTYVDGILFNSASQTGNIKYSGYNSPIIGLSPGTAEYLDGNLSVLKIYNKSLTSSEIKQNFEALRDRYGI